MGRFRKSVLKVLGFLAGNPDHPLCVSTCLFKAEAALKPPEHPTQPQASLHCSQVKAVGENGRSWDQLVPEATSGSSLQESPGRKALAVHADPGMVSVPLS